MITPENRSVNDAITPEIIEGIESVVKDLQRAADCMFRARVHIKEIKNGDYIRGCDGVEVSAGTHEGLQLALEELVKEMYRVVSEAGFGD